MIHTTPDTAKFKRLVRWLRSALGAMPLSHETIAVGILERLWHFTAKNAQAGDIGRFGDDEIAEAVGWHGDAGELIRALTDDLGWLDRSHEYRLVVHDWHEHCPNWIKGLFARHGKPFASQLPSKVPRSVPSTVPGTLPGTVPKQPLPNQPTITDVRSDGVGCLVGAGQESPLLVGQAEYDAARPIMQRLYQLLYPNGRRMTDRDRELIRRASLLVVVRFDAPQWIDEIATSIREVDPKNPVAYFKGCLRRKCEKLNLDLNEQLAAVKIELNGKGEP